MGVHYPFGYVGYETTFLHTFIDLLDKFCSSCHTNDDVGNNCRLCLVGQLIYASKEYVLSSHESDMLSRESKVLRKIKTEIKKFRPGPHFNGGFVFDRYRAKDMLLPLRELLKDLRFLEDQRLRSFMLNQDVEAKISKQVYREVAKRMKKLEDKHKKVK